MGEVSLILTRILSIVPDDVPLRHLSVLLNRTDVDDWFCAIAW